MKNLIPLLLTAFSLHSYGNDHVSDYIDKIEAVFNDDSIRNISQQLLQSVDNLPLDQISLDGALKGLDGINLENINLDGLESLKALVDQANGDDQAALNRAFKETLDPLLEKVRAASSDTEPAEKVFKSIKNISDAMLNYIEGHLKDFASSLPKG